MEMDFLRALSRSSAQNSGSRETDVRCPFRVRECFWGREFTDSRHAGERAFPFRMGVPGASTGERMAYSFRSDHPLGLHGVIELTLVDEAEPDRLFLQGGAVPVGRFRHSRGVVVTDPWGERRH